MKLIQKLSVVLLMGTLSMPLQAQLPADEYVARELRKIGQAVEALEKTMRRSTEHSRVSLLLQRAELEVAGITSLEAQVRSARTMRDAQIVQEEQTATHLDDVERRAFEAADEEMKAQLRQESKQMAIYIETARKQTQAAEQRLFDLEDELSRRSSVFDALKVQIDELLGIE